MPDFSSRQNLLSKLVITEHLWRFAHESGYLAAPAMRLLPDGIIANYDHPNERKWRLNAGKLEFISQDGQTSVRFDEVSKGVEGRIRLRGLHLLNQHSIILTLEQRRWGEDENPFTAQTRLRLKNQIDNAGWTVGAHSYGLPLVYTNSTDKLHIGRYCSIGESVTIVLSNHRPDLVTTYPFSLYRNYWPGAPEGLTDHAGKGDVVVGNDVWIGHGALITAGVKIGDGAVIGGQTVVTRDVAPYAVVGGNPARVLRYRFDQKTIDKLLELRWWDWPEERVEHCIPYLLSDDISGFIAEAARKSSIQDPCP